MITKNVLPGFSPIKHAEVEDSYHKSYNLSLKNYSEEKPSPIGSIYPNTPIPKQDYELLLQYELKREKEKNSILNERLKNKEAFILEMKNIQEELTSAYSRCQAELNEANLKIYEFENNEIRSYKEQIAELRQELFQFQQSDLHKAKPPLQQKRPSKSKSFAHIQKAGPASFSHSIKEPSYGKSADDWQKKRKAEGYVKTFDMTRQNSRGKFSSVKLPSNNGSKLRISERPEQRYVSSGGQIPKSDADREHDCFEQEVLNSLSKVSDFVRHFMQMTRFYIGTSESDRKLTHQLKNSWRWIKEVVRQWDQLRQNCKEQKGDKQGHSVEPERNSSRGVQVQQESEQKSGNLPSPLNGIKGAESVLNVFEGEANPIRQEPSKEEQQIKDSSISNREPLQKDEIQGESDQKDKAEGVSSQNQQGLKQREES